jgi:hypothetical protein
LKEETELVGYLKSVVLLPKNSIKHIRP